MVNKGSKKESDEMSPLLKSRTNRIPQFSASVAIAFIMLAIALETVIATYWFTDLSPRLNKEAEANAQ
ncbi:MAG: hypothetical protein MI864_02710, partial [Pseudomonadales bacterium]|nr:hypothetical protein [Pseudomonadales bacterium]